MHRRWLVRRGIAAGLGALWTMSISAAVRADPRPQIIGVGNVAALAATGGISPAALPGYQLRLVRSEWRPDSPPDVQRRSGACVACVG